MFSDSIFTFLEIKVLRASQKKWSSSLSVIASSAKQIALISAVWFGLV